MAQSGYDTVRPTSATRRSTQFACLRGRPRSRERLVQGLTFVLRQLVAPIIDDQIKLSTLRQPRWLVEVQPPVLDTCTQRRHVITVRRHHVSRTIDRIASDRPNASA